MENPVLVEILRGNTVESRHRGAIAVSDATGKLVDAVGDVERPVFPRSAVKPIQALPLVESGAAERFRLGPKEIALACASHHGEKAHTTAVAAWLERIGLSERDLECGAHLPYDTATAHALLRAGGSPCPLHSNCSGKHSGFLTTAVHKGERTRGYIDYEHPVQRRVTDALSEMCGIDAPRAPWGIDGCGIPTIALPLRAIARGMARMADTTGLPPERVEAARRIREAMAAEPLMVDGTGGFATEVMKAVGRDVLVKPGAEGIFCAILPKRGLGVALKIDDGAGRASEVAMASVLERLGINMSGLEHYLRPVVRNVAGREVGMIRGVIS
ncbi:MAG: asparaginase [Rhodospirillales bacterium]|nr:asparaginase [Rhodospirillales bacterium]